jgi:hypothetical protein
MQPLDKAQARSRIAALFDKVSPLLEGETLNDVASLGASLLLFSLARRCQNKALALVALHVVYKDLAEQIDTNYERLRGVAEEIRQ